MALARLNTALAQGQFRHMSTIAAVTMDVTAILIVFFNFIMICFIFYSAVTVIDSDKSSFAILGC